MIDYYKVPLPAEMDIGGTLALIWSGLKVFGWVFLVGLCSFLGGMGLYGLMLFKQGYLSVQGSAILTFITYDFQFLIYH